MNTSPFPSPFLEVVALVSVLLWGLPLLLWGLAACFGWGIFAENAPYRVHTIEEGTEPTSS